MAAVDVIGGFFDAVITGRIKRGATVENVAGTRTRTPYLA